MSSKIRAMRRAMQPAGKKAVARQVHIFSGLYDEVKKVCLDINTAMVEAHEAVVAQLSDEDKEKATSPEFQFLDPSTFIHTVLANGVNGYWAEKKAAVAKAEGKGLIQVVGGAVAGKLKAQEAKLARERKV